jgi:hypothetical protein
VIEHVGVAFAEMEDCDGPPLAEVGESGKGSSPALAARSPRIGKIERVLLREVWPHEAYDLTTWLEENIDVLNDVLDLNLSNVERERTAGLSAWTLWPIANWSESA